MGLTESDAVKQAMLDIKLVTEFCGIEEEKEIIPQVSRVCPIKRFLDPPPSPPYHFCT